MAGQWSMSCGDDNLPGESFVLVNLSDKYMAFKITDEQENK